jgi:hypothetical protein
MENPFVKALLLGENASGSSYLRWQLENRGCHCWFAHSIGEAAAIFQEHRFDLILSTSPLPKFDPLLALLSSSNCKIFHCQPEEDSCWWLPLSINEQKSVGSGMRPSEFLEMLDKMLSQRRPKTISPPCQIPAVQPELRAFKAAS